MSYGLAALPLFADTMPPGSGAMLLAWLAAIGGAIGSFLNVVVYRVPAGMSLVRPGSHCPVCKHPIRWHDNVPVLGWLFLRGRCRDCRTSIPVRYPAVEAIAATAFLGLGLAAILGGGTYAPLRPESVIDGVIYPPMTPERLVGLMAYHGLLFATLIASVLIEYDRKPLPLGVLVPALLAGGLTPLAWPFLHPVPAAQVLNGGWGGAWDGACGLLVGAVLGAGSGWMLPSSRRGGWEGATSLIGLFLGWQAIAMLTVVAIPSYLFAAAVSRLFSLSNRIPPSAWLALIAWAWVLAWKRLPY